MQLRARRGLGPNFADDRLAGRGELVSGDSVHDQLLCDGSSGVMPSCCVPQCGQWEGAQSAAVNGGLHEQNADGAAGGSGAPVASFAGGGGGAKGCAHGIPSEVLPLRADHGGLSAAAGVSGLAREHSALQVASSARGLAAESAQLGGAGASRLRRQARSGCFDFVARFCAVIPTWSFVPFS